jgi:hypothetical protein
MVMGNAVVGSGRFFRLAEPEMPLVFFHSNSDGPTCLSHIHQAQQDLTCPEDNGRHVHRNIGRHGEPDPVEIPNNLPRKPAPQWSLFKTIIR